MMEKINVVEKDDREEPFGTPLELRSPLVSLKRPSTTEAWPSMVVTREAIVDEVMVINSSGSSPRGRH